MSETRNGRRMCWCGREMAVNNDGRLRDHERMFAGSGVRCREEDTRTEPRGTLTVGELRALIRELPDSTEVWTYDQGMPATAEARIYPTSPNRLWIG